jgi:Protein of unknown function (DUF3379)
VNCLDYRRALLAGEDETDAMRMHRLHCLACSAFFSEQAPFEAELRRGLEVPIPAELPHRLVAAVAGERAAASRRTDRRRLLAAAAAAVGAVGLGVYAWRTRDDPLAMACIDFVMKEEAKSIMMGAMPRSDASRALADALPLERLERIGQIKHIGPCPFNGGTAYHVVLVVPQDKVTLLVMPDARLSARRQAVHEGLHAWVIPLRRGSVGIVGASADVVESVAGALRG